MSTAQVPTIDVHAHVWLHAVDTLARGSAGYEDNARLEQLRAGSVSIEVNARLVKERGPLMADVNARLGAMDRTNVDVQVVSVVPPQYHVWADRTLAWELAMATNEGVAEHCSHAPDRLTGLGVVPLQHPDLCAAALEHAVERGLRGIEISSHAPDPDGGTVELSDARLDPLWRRAEELGAVVFLHPWGCTLDARLDRWFLSNSVGQPVEHAVALSHLIFGGVLDRFPGLRLLAGHGGGYLPMFLGRNDRAWRVRPEARSCVELPSSYLRRMWFDTVVHTPEALRALVAVVGHERVVLGTDHPFDMGEDDPLALLHAAVSDPAALAAIRGVNAAALGLVPASKERSF